MMTYVEFVQFLNMPVRVDIEVEMVWLMDVMLHDSDPDHKVVDALSPAVDVQR